MERDLGKKKTGNVLISLVRNAKRDPWFLISSVSLLPGGSKQRCGWNSSLDPGPCWCTVLELSLLIFIVEIGYILSPTSAHLLGSFLLEKGC